MGLKLKHFLRDMGQQGMSLVATIVMITVATGSIAYVVIQMLPKLQEEKSKASQKIEYRNLLTSINDFVVYAMRERWCLTTYDTTIDTSDRSAKITTNLTRSATACASTVKMEDIVTYPGNLERILFDSVTIGADGEHLDPDGKPLPSIISLNEYFKTVPPTPKATRTLTEKEISLNTLELTIDQTSIDPLGTHAINDLHPLWPVIHPIRGCLDKIVVTLSKDTTTTSGSGNDAVRVGIKTELITKNISRCGNTMSIEPIKHVSASYYTFYPRRLHSFALLHYGDYDTKKNIIFHSPVYIAGDVVLPPEGYDKNSSTHFRDITVLGVYNDSSVFEAGRIKDSNGNNFSVAYRGHPLQTKQDNYPNFGGFAGGVLLEDEDKGFYNIFGTGGSSGQIADLEACLIEEEIMLNGEKAAGSHFLYSKTASSPDTLVLAFSKPTSTPRINRYKPNGALPAVTSGQSSINHLKISVPPPPNGTPSSAVIKVMPNELSSEMAASIGEGSEVHLEIDFDSAQMNASHIDTYITNINAATKDNYEEVIPNTSALYNSLQTQRLAYDGAALNLKNLCDLDAGSDCEVLGYTATCTTCDYATQKTAYTSARSDLITKLNSIKSFITASGEAKIIIAMQELTTGGKKIINKRQLTVNYTSKWNALVNYAGLTEIFLEFGPYHFNPANETFRFNASFEIGPSTTVMKFYNPATTLKSSLQSSWRKGEDNSTMPSDHHVPDRTALQCPDGMGLADWDQDMSASSDFAWNYSGTPAGVYIGTDDHDPTPSISFSGNADRYGLSSTNADYLNQSVVTNCIIDANTTTEPAFYVFGLFVCENLTIKATSKPVIIIGSIITRNINIESGVTKPIEWYSLWHPVASDYIRTVLKKGTCDIPSVAGSNFDLARNDPALKSLVTKCSAADIVNNGPNNFYWTTVDPEVGLANPGDIMTSQKVKGRARRFMIVEDSRKDATIK